MSKILKLKKSRKSEHKNKNTHPYHYYYLHYFLPAEYSAGRQEPFAFFTFEDGTGRLEQCSLNKKKRKRASFSLRAKDSHCAIATSSDL